MTTETAKTYEEIRSAHRWDIPGFYNIAEDVCDRNARERHDQEALFIEYDDRVERMTYGQLYERQLSKCKRCHCHYRPYLDVRREPDRHRRHESKIAGALAPPQVLR